MSKTAILGGTGLSQLSSLKISSTGKLETPFGNPSAEYIQGKINNTEIIFLARHGIPHAIPPHMINYRANIWGLKQLGVTDIIAVAAVGGISAAMYPAQIVLPDQIIDYSYGREHTFFAENLESVTHIDFTYPYDKQLIHRLTLAAKEINLNVISSAIYGCTQGPRLETSAEITRMENDGCDLVGMTGMPEAALARELNINYVTIAVIANWAAGKSDGIITMTEIEQHLNKGMLNVNLLLDTYLSDN